MKGALFAKRKVHEKFKYIETEADIKSVSASVVQMCLLCEFFLSSNTIQILFEHHLKHIKKEHFCCVFYIQKFAYITNFQYLCSAYKVCIYAYTLSTNLTSFSPCKRRNVLRRLLS